MCIRDRPITIFAFGGVSGNGGQSVAIAGLLASGANIIAAVVGTDFWINLIDRALAMVKICIRDRARVTYHRAKLKIRELMKEGS